MRYLITRYTVLQPNLYVQVSPDLCIGGNRPKSVWPSGKVSDSTVFGNLSSLTLAVVRGMLLSSSLSSSLAVLICNSQLSVSHARHLFSRLFWYDLNLSWRCRHSQRKQWRKMTQPRATDVLVS